MWLAGQSGDEITEALRHAVGESRTDFEAAAQQGEASRFGLPIPDQSKTNKSFWMLPNLSSFTNIYARINLLHERAVEGITLVHDEQAQFDRVLESGNIATEKLLDLGAHLSLAHSDYGFEQQADSRIFAARLIVLASKWPMFWPGLSCVLFKAIWREMWACVTQYSEAFRLLLTFSDPRRGTGINFLLTNRDVRISLV